MSTYDASLLKDSPEVSNQARQEGYNVDLLGEKPAVPSRPLSTPANEPVHTRRSVHPPGRTRLAEEDVPPIPMNHIEQKRVPFWRTTKGLTLIAIGIIVIIGAIVGGAVGGAVSHKNKKNAALPPNSAGQSAGDGGGGAPASAPATASSSKSSSSDNAINGITGAPPSKSTGNSNGVGSDSGGGSNNQVRRGPVTTAHASTTSTSVRHQATHAKETAVKQAPSETTESKPSKVTPTEALADVIGRVIGGYHL